MPLPGVESLFLTGTTVQMVGLDDMGAEKGVMQKEIEKETIMKDVQFRGAISDFYVIKQKIQDSEMETLIIRTNEDDLYGDGNNFDLIVSGSVIDTIKFIHEETQRRELHAKIVKAKERAERMMPRSKRKRIINPWVSGGSEIEIEEASLRSHREPISMVVQQVRRRFNQPIKLSNKEANDGWSSAQNECRPYKDHNYDLKKVSARPPFNCILN